MSESKHTPGQVITTISGPVMAGYLQGHAIGSLEHNTLIAGVFSDVRGGPEVAAANAARLALCWNTHDEAVALLKECLSCEFPVNEKAVIAKVEGFLKMIGEGA